MFTLKTFVSCIVIASVPVETFAFPSQDDETSGIQALRYGKRAAVWARLDLGGVDGTVETSPPDSIKYDRKMESYALIGAEVPVAPDLSLRGNLKANWVRHKEEEKDPPKSPIDKSYLTSEPSLDLTYVNPQGLELVFGTSFFTAGSYQEKQISDATSSTTEFDSVSFFVPRFALVRRGSAWSGGFYYVFGREGTRSFQKSASDESTTSGRNPVYIPAVLGVVGAMTVSGMDLELDLAQVKAGDGGEKSDDGVTIRDDYLRLGVSCYHDFGGMGAKAKLFHNTLSYSSNAFISMESIPVTVLHLLLIEGSRDANAFYGIIYGYGKDGQSIPEFNADYRMNALAVTTGLVLPM